MGGKLTKLQYTAYTSNALTYLINTQINTSSVYSAVNSLTLVESKKFGRIQKFLQVWYKVLATSVWCGMIQGFSNRLYFQTRL